jgi:hypothetical protein
VPLDRDGLNAYGLAIDYHEPTRDFLDRIIAEPLVPAGWRHWAERHLDRLG